jgi:hypothetical protein
MYAQSLALFTYPCILMILTYIAWILWTTSWFVAHLSQISPHSSGCSFYLYLVCWTGTLLRQLHDFPLELYSAFGNFMVLRITCSSIFICQQSYVHTYWFVMPSEPLTLDFCYCWIRITRNVAYCRSDMWQSAYLNRRCFRCLSFLRYQLDHIPFPDFRNS